MFQLDNKKKIIKHRRSYRNLDLINYEIQESTLEDVNSLCKKCNPNYDSLFYIIYSFNSSPNFKSYSSGKNLSLPDP